MRKFIGALTHVVQLKQLHYPRSENSQLAEQGAATKKYKFFFFNNPWSEKSKLAEQGAATKKYNSFFSSQPSMVGK